LVSYVLTLHTDFDAKGVPVCTVDISLKNDKGWSLSIRQPWALAKDEENHMEKIFSRVYEALIKPNL